jgi:hypothetical protein
MLPWGCGIALRKTACCTQELATIPLDLRPAHVAPGAREVKEKRQLCPRPALAPEVGR